MPDLQRVDGGSCMQVVTRFAPSPTGWLHLGHVYAAWFARDAARRAGGRFLVRLEDIDPGRCRPEYAAAALEDLAWLDLAPDGPIRVQSAHLAEYRAALEDLAGRRLVYPCFCSRAEVMREAAASAAAPHAPDGGAVYPGTCRESARDVRAGRLAAGEPHSWRLDMRAALAGAPELRFFEQGGGGSGMAGGVPGDGAVGWTVADPARFGDVVLGRRDAPASYHLCVTHDDALQGVSLVTRGADLRPATHVHVLLQHLMGWPTPRYAHHGLLLGADGVRLAKRHAGASIRSLRVEGWRPEQVVALARGGVGCMARGGVEEGTKP